MSDMADMRVAQEGRSAWQVPPDVGTHAGIAIPPDADFFAAPPPEIGEVLAAHTTLTTRKRAMSAGTRWAVVAGAFGVVLVGVQIGGYVLAHPSPGRAATVSFRLGLISLGAALLAGFIALLITRFHHTCTYVGRLGMARYTVTGSRGAEPKVDLLAFAEAASLHVERTQHYTNGVYSNTTYQYTWKDDLAGQGASNPAAAGLKPRVVFRLAGSYSSKKDTPKPKDPYYFAVAGEAAWSEFLMAKLAADFEEDGFVEFPVTGGKVLAVRVAADYLEFVLPQGEERIGIADIGDVELKDGRFAVKHKDARFLSRKGKFSLQYSQLGNGLAFLFCLERLAGISFSG